MENWFDYPEVFCDLENDPHLLEKLMLDEEYDNQVGVHKSVKKERANTWDRKRRYKKKTVRKFLSLNPAMDYSGLYGMRCASAIYLCYPYVVDGVYQDPQTEYCINPYTKVFLSRHGDLRIYRGNISYINGNFALSNKDRTIQRTTNKRIRKEAENEERPQTYSYYKKSLGPKQYSGW